jgi:hypothetical protein
LFATRPIATSLSGKCFLAFEAITRTFQTDDLCVMDQPVDHRCGYDDVAAKDLAPAAEGAV